MNHYKITAPYFSPAGGTLRALQTLCGYFKAQTDPEYVNVTMPQEMVKTYDLGEDDLLIAAFPVYAGRIPAVPGLFANFHGNNTPCVILAAYGNRHYDDAIAQLKRQLTEQGFVCIGAAACITPHVFAPSLGAGRPDEEDKKVLLEFAKAVEEKLMKQSFKAQELTVPGNEMPEPKPSKPVEKVRDEKRCVDCKSCAVFCPVQAIDRETLKVNQEVCINCLNCVHVCRSRAITYHCEALNEFLTGHFSESRKIETFL